MSEPKADGVLAEPSGQEFGVQEDTVNLLRCRAEAHRVPGFSRTARPRQMRARPGREHVSLVSRTPFSNSARFSAFPPQRPKLGPWLGVIGAILEDDKQQPKKQRHTAKRIFERLRMMEKYQMRVYEQPGSYWDLAGLKYCRDHSPTPIVADEAVHSPYDALTVVRENAVDTINIKLMKAGGLLRGAQIATVAASAGVTCMVGCTFETRLGLTAGAHLVGSQKNIVYADLDSFMELAVDPVIGGMQLS